MHPDFTKCVNGETSDPRASEAVYAGLRRRVGRVVGAEPGGTAGRVDRPNLTAVVHEVWLRLSRHRAWRDRTHYLRVAALTARRVLVEAARVRMRRPRCSIESLGEGGIEGASRESHSRVLRIDALLRELRRVSPRAAEVARLRLFGDPPPDAIAEVLGVSTRTVERDWQFAHAWVTTRLADPPPDLE